MQEEREDKIFHKIEAGKKYRVWKKTTNDVNYYSIQATQKNYNGTTDKFYLAVQFKKGVELTNGTDIIIHCAYENLRNNPKDQYNPIYYLVITDFEIVERQEQIEEQALNDYNNAIDEVSIDDDFLD